MKRLLMVLTAAMAAALWAQQPDKVSEQDGMPQILVPAGNFTMGADDADANGRTAEFPPHSVRLDAYWIDRHEVTNAQFADFLNARAPGDLERIYRYCDLANDACRIQFDAETGVCTPEKGYEDYPVCAVSWYGASDYAMHVKRRLPTEAEWERAARGTDARRYPWGNEWTPKGLVTSEAGHDEAQPVGSTEGDRSPCGAQDMAGNVKEWVEDVWEENFYLTSPPENPLAGGSRRRGVTRGGAWCLTEWDARTTSRQPLIPSACRRYMGFRCAETVPPPLPPSVDVSEQVLFYAPMDESVQAAAARGSRRSLQTHGDIRYVPGKRGQAALLGEDGNGRCWVDYDTENNIRLDQGTIAFWLQTLGWKGTDPGFRFFFMLRDAARAKFYIYRFTSGNLLVLAGNGVEGEWGSAGTSTNDWKDGEWRHIAVTWKDRVVTLYVNGKKTSATTVPPEKYFREMPAFFSLGQSQEWNQGDVVRAQTAIDEFVIFSDPLTPERIQAEMTRQTPP